MPAKALALTLAVLAGCNAPFKGSPADPVTPVKSGVLEPVGLQIHPFTRLARNEGSGDWILDAQVQLIDALDDPTKALGAFRVELYAVASEMDAASTGRRAELWRVDLSTLEAQRKAYDRTSRAYALRLMLGGAPPAGAMKLVVVFTDTAGGRLMLEAPLRAGRRGP